MEVFNFNVVCGIFFLIHNFILLDGFQWSLRQQESDVIDVAVGSDITLPCEYILTPEEQQEADVFHLITWTREEPVNSKNWTGLAAKSKLTGSKIIHDDPGRISFTEGSLTLKNINVKDHTFYQCAFYSSFFTTPSTIELNVQYKPTETQLTAPSKEAKEGEPFKITCTARANPTPVYQFYRDGKLIQRTSTGVLSFPSIKTEDGGTYRCVPTNKVGEGPEAIVTFTVTVHTTPKDTLETIKREQVEQKGVLKFSNKSPVRKAQHAFTQNHRMILSSKNMRIENKLQQQNGWIFFCITCTSFGYCTRPQQCLFICIFTDKPTETQLTAPSKEAKEGEPFKITCTARANPTPVYQFYRDGKLIRRTSKGVLSFPSIKTEDEGTYRCVPTNKIGEGPEAIVTFTVTVKAYELFPNWAYGAVGGGVLLIIIVAIVVSICCARKGKKKPDNRRKTSQPQNKTRKPKDAREAHVGPGAFYVDNVNGQTEIPRLNEAFSFGDIRMSREFPHLNGALSFNDLRTSHGNYHLNGGFSLGDVRASREALPMKSSFSVDDVRLGEAMQGTYPPQSVTHLIDGVEEHVSNL
ncbi:unnamed protein product [Porites evermanni]|uniref:Ig-like domain-containing protein n=1 Tax=Porites evermanni TaxID=104178 RepID=A0ABN8M7A5_9CNID|nr:unnamed protein product [Porites evermanni]